MWCGITGRLPFTPLNVLRWKSNLLTFKKRFSSLFLLNFECDIALICHCGAKRDIFWIKGKFTFSPFCQLQCTFKTFFLLQLYKFLFVFFCVEQRKRSNAMNSKEAKWNKMRNNFKLFSVSISIWPYKFIYNLKRNTRKIIFKSDFSELTVPFS